MPYTPTSLACGALIRAYVRHVGEHLDFGPLLNVPHLHCRLCADHTPVSMDEAIEGAILPYIERHLHRTESETDFGVAGAWSHYLRTAAG